MIYSFLIALMSIALLTDPAQKAPDAKKPAKLGPAVYRDSVNRFQFNRPYMAIADFQGEQPEVPDVKAMYLGAEIPGKIRPAFTLQVLPPSPNVALSQENDIAWLRSSGTLREERKIQLDKFPAVIFAADQMVEGDTLRYVSVIAYTPTCTVNLTGLSSISEFKKYESSFIGAIMSLKSF
ncbi:MAG TPA: hypothetical protein VFH43_10015 [Candidatus Kapabacteria bacterium]|nr:hypothetical protein [Candidatus Kapabacteria bacterium]